jgi:ornithine cyclodeaminase/alanine dehydrogenase-like protein (mu-crystallin family)
LSDHRKPAAQLQADDLVALTPTCTGRVISCKPSHSTPIKPRRGGYSGTALIIVFEAIDGQYRGLVEADFRHPEDIVQCR